MKIQMNRKKWILFACFGVSLLFFILGWVFKAPNPVASRWMYLPGLLGYAGCAAVLGWMDWEKKHKVMGGIWMVIALMAAVLGVVQAVARSLEFRFNPLFFIIVLLLSMILGWEETPKENKAAPVEEAPVQEIKEEPKVADPFLDDIDVILEEVKKKDE